MLGTRLNHELADIEADLAPWFDGALDKGGLGLRNAVVNDAGATRLAEVLRANPSGWVRRLFLQGNPIGDAGAAQLEDALQGNTLIIEVVLGRNKTSRGAWLGVEAIVNQNKQNERRAGAAAAAAVPAVPAAPAAACVQEMRRGAAEKAVAALATGAKEMFLIRSHIGDEGAAQVADALSCNTTCERLDLAGNQISDAGARIVVEALRGNTTLADLGLCGNQITDACGLAEALQGNTTLTAVRLFGNPMSAEVKQAVGAVVKQNKKDPAAAAARAAAAIAVVAVPAAEAPLGGGGAVAAPPVAPPAPAAGAGGGGSSSSGDDGEEAAGAAGCGECGAGAFDVETLQAPDCPAGVDPAAKHLALSDADFEAVFKVGKADFGALPAWKQARAKKAAGLF
jgi:hypothetical protein